jgi:hypothetical protein
MPRLPLTVLIIALAIGLAACGGGSSGGSAAPSAPSDAPPASEAASQAPDEGGAPVAGTDLTACEILTAADIEAALGLEAGTIEQPESEETPTVLSPGHTSCDYSGDDWGGVVVELTPEDGENLYDAARGSYDDASDLVIVGTDGAFWSTSTSRGFVWKGSTATMIQIGFLVESGADRAAITAALLESIASKVD